MNALTAALATAIEDRRSLPMFRPGVGPTKFRGVPVTLDEFVAAIPQSPRQLPIVLFPPNTPLGKLQRAFGVNRAQYDRDLP